MAFEVDKLDAENTPARWRIVGKDLVDNNPSQLDKLDPIYKAVLEKAATFTSDEEMGVGNQPDVGSEPDPIVEPILVTGITVNTDLSELDLSEGDTANLNVDVLPIDADIVKVNYAVTAGTSVTVTPVNGLVAAVEAGVSTITATATDGSGITGTIDITVVE